MDVRKIHSVLITLVEFDQIPFIRLLHSSAIEHIKKKYSFGAVEVRPSQQDQPTILFAMGQYQCESEDCIIQRLEIQDRKIIIEIEGPSEIADNLLKELMQYMKEVSRRDDDIVIIVQSRDSIIIAKMDFSATELVDSKLLKFVNKNVPEKSHLEQGIATTNLSTVNFRIDYLPTEKKLNDYRITLSRKEFSLGPRDGTPVSEQIFISRAPISTNDHLQVLNEIESLYTSKV